MILIYWHCCCHEPCFHMHLSPSLLPLLLFLSPEILHANMEQNPGSRISASHLIGTHLVGFVQGGGLLRPNHHHPSRCLTWY
ncbi:hypothetical protein EDB81DRAFT_413188 [Dactylonectria macrodidyma]|uniref:Secreted protein n=1 Tax=Dactylonectria macrodidyma TaxID=307937 RepID=A0A9P9FB33_9HYPO|nr:hypothetical protein EDB81DRAFT_413188 [Dactylonectria macrodidyma]